MGGANSALKLANSFGPNHLLQSKPCGIGSAGKSYTIGAGPTFTLICFISPIVPLRTSSAACLNSFQERCMLPVWNTRSYLRVACTIALPSFTVNESGFSQ